MVWMVREWRVLLYPVLIIMAFSVIAGCLVPDVGIVLSEDVCEKMSGLDRDHCYLNVARAKDNPEICEKINNPGPRSKCSVYLGTCSDLSWQATGDGAYTSYDCAQYRAINYGSVKLCEDDIRDFKSANRNDLNPTGISQDICIKRVTENCGNIGQTVCFDKYYKYNFCVYGMMDMGKCVPKS